tara:strand:- start:406 stop:540 length:135 start_codon:yes stop_codon:yes gene_type:complete
MKASKLITKKQKNQMWGDYIKFKNKFKNFVTFESFLIKKIYYTK